MPDLKKTALEVVSEVFHNKSVRYMWLLWILTGHTVQVPEVELYKVRHELSLGIGFDPQQHGPLHDRVRREL